MAASNTIEIGPHSNRADMNESFQWFENGTAVTLTGATIVFCARDKETDVAVLNASTDDGQITISTTTMTIAIPKESFASLCAKEYKVGCTIEIDDTTDQLFVGTLAIYDGVVP